MSVLLPKQVDLKQNIKYSEVKILKSGAKSIYVNYNGGKLMIQTPVLTIPYGVNDNTRFMDKKSDKPDDKKYDLTVSFRGMEDNPKIKSFHDKLVEMEQKLIDDAFQNRQAWFKNTFGNNREVLASMFTPIVKVDKDKETGEITNKYPPTFKVKIPYDPSSDTFGFDSYDMDNNEVDFHNVLNNLKGGKCQLIIQLNGLWLGGGLFGCSWKIVSGKFQQTNMISKPVFLQDSDTEKVGNDEDDDDIEVDTEVVKPVKKPSLKVEVPPTKLAAPVKKSVPPPPAPSEEEDTEEDEDGEDGEADTEVHQSNDPPEEEEDADDNIEVDEAEPEKEPTPPPTPPPVVKPAVKKAVKKVAKC